MTSAWVRTDESIEKTFESLREAINITEKNALDSRKKLENQLTIEEIQKIQKLPISMISISTTERNDWTRNDKVPTFSVPEDFAEFLKSKGYNHFTSTWNNVCTIRLDAVEEDLERALKIINLAVEFSTPINESNIKVVAHNKKIYESILALMKRIGVPETYYGYATKRNKTKSKLTYSWVSELRALIPHSYYNNELENIGSRLKENVKNVFNPLLKAKIEKEKAVKIELERKESERELAYMLAKYGCSIQGTWYDVLDVILGMNKYLRLAHFLEKERNNWSSGDDYAKDAIREFVVEFDVDKLIFADLNSCLDSQMESGDTDGRIFRDTEWNYGKIFELVENGELMEDYLKVKEKRQEY